MVFELISIQVSLICPTRTRSPTLLQLAQFILQLVGGIASSHILRADSPMLCPGGQASLTMLLKQGVGASKGQSQFIYSYDSGASSPDYCRCRRAGASFSTHASSQQTSSMASSPSLSIWGQLTCISTTRVSSAALSRLGIGSALLSATGERWW